MRAFDNDQDMDYEDSDSSQASTLNEMDDETSAGPSESTETPPQESQAGIPPANGIFRICHTASENVSLLPHPTRFPNTLWRRENLPGDLEESRATVTEGMRFCQKFWQLRGPYLSDKSKLEKVTEDFNALLAEVTAYSERHLRIQRLIEALHEHIHEKYEDMAREYPESAERLRNFLNDRGICVQDIIAEFEARLEVDRDRMRALLQEKVEVLNRIQVSGTELEHHIAFGRRQRFMEVMCRDESSRVALEHEFDELLRLDYD